MSWDGEVETEVKRLTLAQERRVLRMVEVLRDPINMQQITHVKESIQAGQIEDAKALWSEFTDEEQQALWVAPSKGGILTTREREALHHKRKTAA